MEYLLVVKGKRLLKKKIEEAIDLYGEGKVDPVDFAVHILPQANEYKIAPTSFGIVFVIRSRLEPEKHLEIYHKILHYVGDQFGARYEKRKTVVYRGLEREYREYEIAFVSFEKVFEKL